MPKSSRYVSTEPPQAYEYRGFVFPKYEGELTNDEIRSNKVFFAFWGDRYLIASAIRYQVDVLLEQGKVRPFSEAA